MDELFDPGMGMPGMGMPGMDYGIGPDMLPGIGPEQYMGAFQQQQDFIPQDAMWGMSQALDNYAPQFGPMAYDMPFEPDREKLGRLGFTEGDISTLQMLVQQNRNRMPTRDKLRQMGYNENQSVMFRYMYNISIGRIEIDTREAMAKHLRKLWRGPRIGLNHLPYSTVSELNRYCLVAHLPKPYDSLNSNRYYQFGGLKEGMYKVDKIAGGRTYITTPRRPVLTRNDSQDIPGVIRVESVNRRDDTITYSIDNKYVRICNRFVIAASLRRPLDHLGLSSILCMDGTTIYVMALPVKSGAGKTYYSQSQRVYAYGVDKEMLLPTLHDISVKMFNYFKAFMMEQEHGNIDYEQLVDPARIAAAKQAQADSTVVDFDNLEDE